MSTDPDEALRQLLEGGRSVKLGRGVTGKTTNVSLALIALWSIVLLKWDANLIVDAGMAGVGTLATLFGVWYIYACHSFAENNPAQAMLDGAEFLEYKRMEIAAKDLPTLAGPNVDVTQVPGD